MQLPAVKSLAFGSPVSGVAGFIDKLYPPKGDKGWSLQNGTLKDRAGNEVEFMFSRFPSGAYMNPLTDRGKWVEIVAIEPGDLVWAEQNTGKGPFGKLEVKNPRCVARSTPPTQETLFAFASEPSPSGAARGAGEAQPATAAGDAQTVEAEVGRLGALYELCCREAQSAAGRLELSEERRDALVLSSATTIFVQATREGLHRRLSVKELATKRLPEHLQKLAGVVGDQEQSANMLLRFEQVITNSQTWRDVPADKVPGVLSNARFLETLRVG